MSYAQKNLRFPSAPDHEVNEDVIGLGKYNKTLTVLFTQEEIEFEEESVY